MKVSLDRSDERGKGEYGWLTTRYSFSFANWYNPSKMGFGTLRVINDDIIAPDHGFGTHGHKNMEIITIVTKGEVTHTDSMGNTYVVKAGDVQVMSAGTGVLHSEFNQSTSVPLELFQIWIEPKEYNITPRYHQKSYTFHSVKNTTCTLVGESGLSINQGSSIVYGALDRKSSLTYTLTNPKHGIYLFVIDGSVTTCDCTLNRRDAVGISEVERVEITADENATFLIIEVPMK
jgi:redox-sensitive bicupin YhaK (pirin superfamily)